jgi:hypothetical protein
VDVAHATLPKSLYVWDADSDYAARLIGNQLSVIIKPRNPVTITLPLVINGEGGKPIVSLDDNEGRHLKIRITTTLASARLALPDIVAWCCPFRLTVSTEDAQSLPPAKGQEERNVH